VKLITDDDVKIIKMLAILAALAVVGEGARLVRWLVRR
jgi:hypothetical protein